MASSTQIGIQIRFSPSFDASSSLWLIQATSGALNLNFGLWEVRDDSGTVVPLDEAASAISSREFVCSQPLALLADGLTPPTFAMPTPVPIDIPTTAPTLIPTPTKIPTPTHTPLVSTGLQAELRVWLALRDCFSPLPTADSFTAYQDRPGRWLVEGKKETGENATINQEERAVSYGLWIVDSESGNLTAYDDLANGISRRSHCYEAP